MTKKQLLILILINLFIAIGFFLENKGTGFTQLSTDLHNSIPVCYKIDDQTLFQKDLYLFDVKNVKYYTPFYVETIRFFAKCANGDYLLGINIFATLLHLIYGFLWFWLFYKIFKNFSIALLLSILVRGVVWLPGWELWGISDLWTMMPRTMYAAFLPLPFILLFNKSKASFYISAFLIGFIFNLHPITGMGGILMYVLLIFFYNKLYSFKINFKTIGIATLLLILGMIPFLSTYFLQTDAKVEYDILEYKKAFSARIEDLFIDPFLFLGYWLRFRILFFLTPLLLFYAYAQFVDKKYFKTAFLLVSISFFTILIPTLSIFFENHFNAIFNKNLRMSFQIIRAQKIAILTGFFAIGFLMEIFIKRSQYFKKAFNIILPIFIFALIISKEPIFRKVPFFSDDIATSIFPDYNSFFVSKDEKLTDMDNMLTFINNNSNKTDVFYGAFIVRSACKRSVVLDGKGASMLIEGNPVQLIQWYQETKIYKSLSEKEKIKFLKIKKGVTHILSKENLDVNQTKLIHQEGDIKLYKTL